MSDYQVGFIGIGNMGWPMAKNILKAGGNILKPGHKLAVFDLDKARVAKFVAGGAKRRCGRKHCGDWQRRPTSSSPCCRPVRSCAM